MRRAAAFQARLGAWQAQDVYLFYLPTYRPRLNKIETLWRKIKYEWLRPQAYATFQTLKTAVWHILDRVGQQYTIQFGAVLRMVYWSSGSPLFGRRAGGEVPPLRHLHQPENRCNS